jgi:hypothetical protein
VRKLFIGTMLTSLLGAAVIGGVLAWTGSAGGSTTATAGTVSIAFNNYLPTGTAVSPTGLDTWVATTGFTNNGTIAVQPDGGNPGAANVTSTSNALCDTSNFATPRPNTVGGDSGPVNPANNSGNDAFRIYVRMASGAVNACQGVTINYDVTINVTT